MGTIKVKAANLDIPVPYEGGKRGDDLIRDTAVVVPNTRYYRRRIAAGDLIEAKE